MSLIRLRYGANVSNTTFHATVKLRILKQSVYIKIILVNSKLQNNWVWWSFAHCSSYKNVPKMWPAWNFITLSLRWAKLRSLSITSIRMISRESQIQSPTKKHNVLHVHGVPWWPILFWQSWLSWNAFMFRKKIYSPSRCIHKIINLARNAFFSFFSFFGGQKNLLHNKL